MEHREKIAQLRQVISDALLPLIDRDYVYLDLPYYTNIGDSLIADGTHNFLGQVPHRCLYTCSIETYQDGKIPEGAIILLQGGGNFGDLWRHIQEFRNKIVSTYKSHRIIVFPQSVFYSDQELLRQDAEIFSQCKDLTICARDKFSFDFFSEHFKANTVKMVPDMAFFMDLTEQAESKETGKTLFLKRVDKELVDDPRYTQIPAEADVHDWPTFEDSHIGPYKRYKTFYTILCIIDKRLSHRLRCALMDWYWQKRILPFNVSCGIGFLSQYDTIYTTRLHVAILGYLLRKNVYLLDNSSKKISAFYDTWLKDGEKIKILS